MSMYLSTFISGLQAVAAEVLGARRIIKMMDGAVLFESKAPVHAGLFNNEFEVILERAYAGNGALDRLMQDALKIGIKLPIRAASGKARTFRIVCSNENKLTAVNARNKAELEKLIANRSGLGVDRAKADVEYWLYSRSEGKSFLMQRLTYDRVTEKQLQKGELRPELCWALNHLSGPDEGDVFLDPFAGTGAIPLARKGMAGFAKMYAFDIDEAKSAAIRHRLGNAHGLTVRPVDIRRLADAVPAGSVNVVVTDPPWGYYEDINVDALYADMWDALMAATTADARIVLLSARTDELERSIAAHRALRLKSTYHVLVNGKKAGIYVMNRT